MLTPEQLAYFDEHGFVVVDCPFPSSSFEHIRSLLQENTDLTNSDGVRLSRLDPRYTVIDTAEETLDLLQHPFIIHIVRQLYQSDNFRLLMANFNNRTPNIKPMINWHTDYQEMQKPQGPRIEVAWYLTETDEQNGCLRLIPGSHKRTCTDVVRELARIAKPQTLPWRSYAVRHPGEIDLPLGPNKLLIRSGFIWHCTHKNTTDKIRYLYAWSYCPLAERAMLVDYELILPRKIVEFPTPLQSRLFALGAEYRKGLVDRNGALVQPLSERLGYEKDRKWRATEYYVEGEDLRFENP